MKKLILSAFVFINYAAVAQQGVTPPGINIAEHVPQSPTVAGLSKYFDVPVNMNTGQPNISIPIYTIKSGNIVVPITLSYNAGGIRVNEHAGWVGMGWSISTGGVINKRVNGFDDFSTSLQSGGTSSQMQPYVSPAYSDFGMPISNISDIVDSFNFNSSTQVSSTQYANFFARIGNGNIDAEADEYFYSTPEGGGKLFYNQRSAAFEIDKYNGWKVNTDVSMNGNDVGTFTLQSNNALVYEFGIGDYYRNPWYDLPTGGAPGPTQTYFNQAWHLATIKDLVNNKSVAFFNNTVYKTTRNGFSMNNVYQMQGYGYTYKSADYRENLRHGTEITPTEIKFDEGAVLFIKDNAPRHDGGTNALKEIQVRNREGKLIKKYVFTYFYVQSGSYYGCPYQQLQLSNEINICDTLSRRMYLQSVQEVYSGSNNEVVAMPPYQFSYKNPEQLPGRLSFAQDKWGYFNGKVNTTLLASLPAAFAAQGIPAMANRDVDTAYAQKGLLKAIEYPTGGKLLIEMESNMYEGGILGGLRTKRLTNKDNITGQTLVTEYTYAQAAMQFPPKHFYEYFNFQGFGGGNIPREIRIDGEPLYPLLNGQGSPVQYNVVTKKQVGNGEELVSKHYFNNVVQPGYGQFTSSELGVPRPKNPAMEGFLGLEDATEIYDPNGVLLQKDSVVHEPLNNFAFHLWNIQTAVASPTFMTEWIIWPGNDPFFTSPPNVGTAMNYYAHFKENAIKTKQYRLGYDSDNGIKSTGFTAFVHDKANSNLLLSRSVNSRGDTLISQYKYTTNYLPANPVSIADAQLAYMYEINTISKPIEITNFLKKKNATDSLLTSAAFFEYDSARIKKIYKLPLPQPISNFAPSYLGATAMVKDSRYELETNIIAMDAAGNPLTVQEKNGITALVWDAANDVLAAKVANATHADVAYCSFENESSGNWNIPSPLRDGTTAVTGKKAYHLAQGIITKTGLDGSKIFTVSYWSKNGPQVVNGTSTATTGTTINAFTYYEHTVNYATTITVSGNGIIDELRLYPKGALMATYNYTPMVGITSQCDANNNIQYYEYDAMGRLKVAKDRSSNILKQYDYRYKTLITQ
jgi:hypothetical protein